MLGLTFVKRADSALEMFRGQQMESLRPERLEGLPISFKTSFALGAGPLAGPQCMSVMCWTRGAMYLTNSVECCCIPPVTKGARPSERKSKRNSPGSFFVFIFPNFAHLQRCTKKPQKETQNHLKSRPTIRRAPQTKPYRNAPGTSCCWLFRSSICLFFVTRSGSFPAARLRAAPLHVRSAAILRDAVSVPSSCRSDVGPGWAYRSFRILQWHC